MAGRVEIERAQGRIAVLDRVWPSFVHRFRHRCHFRRHSLRLRTCERQGTGQAGAAGWSSDVARGDARTPAAAAVAVPPTIASTTRPRVSSRTAAPWTSRESRPRRRRGRAGAWRGGSSPRGRQAPEDGGRHCPCRMWFGVQSSWVHQQHRGRLQAYPGGPTIISPGQTARRRMGYYPRSRPRVTAGQGRPRTQSRDRKARVACRRPVRASTGGGARRRDIQPNASPRPEHREREGGRAALASSQAKAARTVDHSWSLFLTKRCPFAHARHCGRTRLDGAPQQLHGAVGSNPFPAFGAAAFTALSAGFLPMAHLRVLRPTPPPASLRFVGVRIAGAARSLCNL